MTASRRTRFWLSGLLLLTACTTGYNEELAPPGTPTAPTTTSIVPTTASIAPTSPATSAPDGYRSVSLVSVGARLAIPANWTIVDFTDVDLARLIDTLGPANQSLVDLVETVRNGPVDTFLLLAVEDAGEGYRDSLTATITPPEGDGINLLDSLTDLVTSAGGVLIASAAGTGHGFPTATILYSVPISRSADEPLEVFVTTRAVTLDTGVLAVTISSDTEEHLALLADPILESLTLDD